MPKRGAPPPHPQAPPPQRGPATLQIENGSVLAAGQQLSDEQILSMNYLVAGVVGKVSR